MTQNFEHSRAGAMGAAYASMFADDGDFSPFFLADGERYRRLMEKPLRVNGKPYAIPVMRPEDVKEPVDLVLVALKHDHLAECPSGHLCCDWLGDH